VLEKGKCRGRRERTQGDQKCRECHRYRKHVEGEKRPFFLFLVGDVERCDHRGSPVGAAVDCDQEGKQDAEALRLLGSPHCRHQLVADHECDIARKYGGQHLHVFDDRERVGNEAVGKDDEA
jgi:hypothetical protein